MDKETKSNTSTRNFIHFREICNRVPLLTFIISNVLTHLIQTLIKKGCLEEQHSKRKKK